jgi:protein O-mannosyl-transferase
VQSLSGFKSIWSTGRAYSSLPATYGYRPVTTTMNMILWCIGDGQTWVFHLAKILLFFLTCVLLAQIWSRLLPWVSDEVIAVGVLLFAVNPIHSQVVTYIAAIATQWAALFVCLSVYCFLMFRKNENLRWWLYLSLVCALLAILSKEEGVVILALIPLVEFYLRFVEGTPLSSTKRLKDIALFLIPAAIGVGLIVYMFEPTQNLVRTDVSVGSYFMTQWRAYLRYFAMYFYAYDLNADNLEFGFSSHFFSLQVLVALFTNLLFCAVVVFFARRHPALLLALFWFYIGVSPASSVVVLSEPVNDHRAFLGYLGFAIFAILALNWLRAQSRTLFLSASAVLFVTYALFTFQRGEVWSTNEKFWTDVVAKNPSSPRAHNNLGLEMIHQNKNDEALALLKRCYELQVTYPPCYINRGVTLARMGRDADAEKEFARAVTYDRGVIQSHYNWAKFLSSRGNFAKAQELLIVADRFAQGQNFEVRMELLSVLRQMGQLDLAKKMWSEALTTFGSQSSLLTEGRRLGVDSNKNQEND